MTVATHQHLGRLADTLQRTIPAGRVVTAGPDYDAGRQVWNGAVLGWENMEIGEKTGKEFLERNGLAGLKTETDRVIRERYKIRTGHGMMNASVGQMMGVEPKSSGGKKK